jgi:hypothetical protein
MTLFLTVAESSPGRAFSSSLSFREAVSIVMAMVSMSGPDTLAR